MIIVNRKWNKYIRCQAKYYTPVMQGLLQNIDCEIQNCYKVLKNDSTSTVVVAKVEEHYWVIKRANTKGILHFIRRLFSVSRAQKNWKNAQKLFGIGINTFSPIALVEDRWGPFRKRSYLVCSYIQGVEALQYFSDEKTKDSWDCVSQGIVAILRQLAQHWISHRDLNLSNIILVDNSPWLIDLDSMRQHHFLLFARRGARREWERFMQNWEDASKRIPGSLPSFSSVFQQGYDLKN